MTEVEGVATVRQSTSADQPIVVGVDGSEYNRSAILWAAAEAARSGADLMLVTVVDDREFPSLLRSRKTAKSHARQVLETAADMSGVSSEHTVGIRLLSGRPEQELATQFPQARLLVVGKRGLGEISRLLVGSTSLALAGRSTVPVVIVPGRWEADAHDGQPIVLGADPGRPHARLFSHAFRRAARLGVSLLAVHGWETPSADWWPDTSELAAEQERRSHAEFERLMEAWRDRYPDVELHLIASHDHPAVAILDAAGAAQLVVLGRHSNSRFSDFAFGSVTRAVLHYAELPVLVVPTDNSVARRDTTQSLKA